MKHKLIGEASPGTKAEDICYHF